MSNSSHYHENVLGAKEGNADSLAAPGLAGVEDTNQLALKSSKCCELSFCSTHLNPGGAADCVGCDGGNLNRASDIPSLTPALITAYSSQQAMTVPTSPAIIEIRKKLPIASIEASLFLGIDGSSPDSGESLAAQQAARGPACGDASASGAAAQPLPLGNHGEIVSKGQDV